MYFSTHIHRIKKTGVALFLSLAAFSVAPAFGNTIFYDNFDSNSLNLNNPPAGWTSTNGTVDVLVEPNPWGLPCLGGSGACIDLDGSTFQAGVLTSNATFNLIAGVQYTLTYYLAGSQRGDTNTVAVSFGGATQVHELGSAVPYTQFTLLVTPGTNLTGQAISFANSGGDNIGALLDTVELNEGERPQSAVPEPSTMILLGSALAAAVAWRRKS